MTGRLVEFVQKRRVAAALLILLSGCAQSDESGTKGVSDLIMPASEHAGLSAVETALRIDDVDSPPASVPDVVVQALKQGGATGAANVTYTWGDPDGFMLIDGNILLYPTAEAARDSVLSVTEGVESVAGVGDAAFAMGKQSITFSVGAARVSLTAIHGDIDLRSVAETYAAWLAK